MIRQIDLYPILKNHIPSLAERLDQLDDKKNCYKLIRTFTQYTLENFERSDRKIVKKCMFLADYLFENGEDNLVAALNFIFLENIATLVDKADYFMDLPTEIIERYLVYKELA